MDFNRLGKFHVIVNIHWIIGNERLVFERVKKYPCKNRGNWCYYALSTLPDLKQEVHTYVFLAPPSAVLILTDFTLDFHILLDLLCE